MFLLKNLKQVSILGWASRSVLISSGNPGCLRILSTFAPKLWMFAKACIKGVEHREMGSALSLIE